MADPYSRIPFFFKERKHEEHSEHHTHHPKGVHAPAELEGDVAAVTNEIPSTIFEKHAEATNIELFYDLFFVANLTVFSTVKEINDKKTLSQYIGFFCILWFTWYQVSLYDVRFCKDSLFDRMAKLIQFGVMIGFATCGPTFNAGQAPTLDESEIPGIRTASDYDPSFTTFKSITLLMMVSRFVLVVQYIQGMIIFHTRPAYRGNTLPMFLIAATELLAALMYGLLFLAFRAKLNNAYLSWYVISIAETAIATFISAWFRKGISFKGTHLVQRMGLLTLIILGEGVMGLAEKCQVLIKNRIFTFSGTTVSDIFFSVTIIYFLYMLYFDWIVEHHDMGAIKQLIWAFLHFPVHLALVLSVAGTNQFVAFRAGIAKIDDIYNGLVAHNETNWQNSSAMGLWMSNVSDTVFEGALAGAKGSEDVFEIIEMWNKAFWAIGNFTGNPDNDQPLLDNAYTYTVNGVLTAVGFAAPEGSEESDDPTGLEQQENQLRVAQLAYYYFFIACGLYVMLTGLVAWLGKKDKNLAERIRLIVSFCLGAILAVFAVFGAKDATIYFLLSPWVLPLVGFILGIIVLVDHAPLPTSWSRRKHASAPMMTAGSSSTDVGH